MSSDTADLGQIRAVRVLIVSGAASLRLHSDGPVAVLTPSGESIQSYPLLSDAVLRANRDGRLELDGRGFDLPGLVLSRDSAGSILLATAQDQRWSPALEYEGPLFIQSDENGNLSVINHADLESYVAAVVAQEVWPTFHEEALRAQAVTSRTFVLFQMTRRPDARIDVTATQVSQVYRGVRRDEIGSRARAATEYTRGLVLTYPGDDGRDRLFCAYFSAACGGCSQPGAAFGPESDVPPLRGGVRCQDCSIAPGDTYRWGPVAIPIGEVLARLGGRMPEYGAFPTIESIEAIEKTAEGRPVTLRISGGGLRQTILAERFRMILDPAVIRSTDFRVTLADGRVVFTEGKGFGHGLGLCQWGMQGKALKGQRAGEILSYYFPGARILRAY